MAKKYFKLGMLVILLAFGMALVGCDDLATSSCPNGSCHVYTNANGDGSYDVCSRSSCSAYNVPYPVSPGTNVKCNCN
jgi:hypothetical protein